MYLLLPFTTKDLTEHMSILQGVGFLTFIYSHDLYGLELERCIKGHSIKNVLDPTFHDSDLGSVLRDSFSIVSEYQIWKTYSLMTLDQCLELNSNDIESLGSGLAEASYFGNLDLISILLRGPQISKEQLVFAFKIACMSILAKTGAFAILLLRNRWIADVEFRNTALILASRFGKHQAAGYLIYECRADPAANGSECLRLACTKGYIKLTELLLETNANTAAQNNEALLAAVLNGDEKVVEMLLINKRPALKSVFMLF